MTRSARRSVRSGPRNADTQQLQPDSAWPWTTTPRSSSGPHASSGLPRLDWQGPRPRAPARARYTLRRRSVPMGSESTSCCHSTYCLRNLHTFGDFQHESREPAFAARSATAAGRPAGAPRPRWADLCRDEETVGARRVRPDVWPPRSHDESPPGSRTCAPLTTDARGQTPGSGSGSSGPCAVADRRRPPRCQRTPTRGNW